METSTTENSFKFFYKEEQISRVMAKVSKLENIFKNGEIAAMILFLHADENNLVEKGQMMSGEERKNYWSDVWVA